MVFSYKWILCGPFSSANQRVSKLDSLSFSSWVFPEMGIFGPLRGYWWSHLIRLPMLVSVQKSLVEVILRVVSRANSFRRINAMVSSSAAELEVSWVDWMTSSCPACDCFYTAKTAAASYPSRFLYSFCVYLSVSQIKLWVCKFWVNFFKETARFFVLFGRRKILWVNLACSFACSFCFLTR